MRPDLRDDDAAQHRADERRRPAEEFRDDTDFGDA